MRVGSVIAVAVLSVLFASGTRQQAAEKQPKGSQDQLRITVVDGLLSYLYRIDEAARGYELIHLAYNQHDLKLEGFPGGSEAFQKANVIVFANAGIGFLDKGQLQALKSAIVQGAGLMILGGKTGYGASGIKGSILEEVVPVEIADTVFDIERRPGVLQSRDKHTVSGLSLPLNLVSPYIHRAGLRQGSDLIISAGGRPFLVSGVYGRGRVVCLLGTPYGTAPKGGTLFYEWKGWPELLRNTLRWLAHREP